MCCTCMLPAAVHVSSCCRRSHCDTLSHVAPRLFVMLPFFCRNRRCGTLLFARTTARLTSSWAVTTRASRIEWARTFTVRERESLQKCVGVVGNHVDDLRKAAVLWPSFDALFAAILELYQKFICSYACHFAVPIFITFMIVCFIPSSAGPYAAPIFILLS